MIPKRDSAGVFRNGKTGKPLFEELYNVNDTFKSNAVKIRQ